MSRIPNLTAASKGSITSASPLTIEAGDPSYTKVSIVGKGFSEIFYQNKVHLFFVKDAQPTPSSNVSVLEPLEESGKTNLIVPMKALEGVLEELQGFKDDNAKFKLVVEVMNEDGKVVDTIVGGSKTYIQFT